MSFLDLVKQRQSTRRYDGRPVEREKIEKCIEAARLAPSACNSQPWKFIIVDKAELKTKIAQTTFSKILSFNKFSMQAAVFIVIVSEKSKLAAQAGAVVKNKDFRLMDIAIAAEHFCLQAAESGIGTCMMGWFNQGKMKKLLAIPKTKKVELIIAAGYPADDTIRTKQRKTTEQIASYNKY